MCRACAFIPEAIAAGAGGPSQPDAPSTPTPPWPLRESPPAACNPTAPRCDVLSAIPPRWPSRPRRPAPPAPTRRLTRCTGQLAGNIYVVGNAPTALLRLAEHVISGQAQPALVVGLPVGFVNGGRVQGSHTRGRLPLHNRTVAARAGQRWRASVINATGRTRPARSLI